MPRWLREWLRYWGRVLVVLGAVAVAVAWIWGTPHLRVSYACRLGLRPGSSEATGCRIYDYCWYLGFAGWRLESDDKCEGILTLLPVRW